MKSKPFIILTLILLLVFKGYGQEDSMRTRNDKPGTPQSLRTPDQSPESRVDIINSNTAPGLTQNHAAAAGAIVNTNVTTNTVPASPITIKNNSRRAADTAVNNSAIQNGISNATNPIRKE